MTSPSTRRLSSGRALRGSTYTPVQWTERQAGLQRALKWAADNALPWACFVPWGIMGPSLTMSAHGARRVTMGMAWGELLGTQRATGASNVAGSFEGR
jgi:hypothetical protein